MFRNQIDGRLSRTLIQALLLVGREATVKATTTHPHTNMDTLGIEPRASRMLSGCDTTTPCAHLSFGIAASTVSVSATSLLRLAGHRRQGSHDGPRQRDFQPFHEKPLQAPFLQLSGGRRAAQPKVDTLGFEPRAFRMRSGWIPLHHVPICREWLHDRNHFAPMGHRSACYLDLAFPFDVSRDSQDRVHGNISACDQQSLALSPLHPRHDYHSSASKLVRGSASTAYHQTVWPSGLRRWLQAPIRKSVGSNHQPSFSIELLAPEWALGSILTTSKNSSSANHLRASLDQWSERWSYEQRVAGSSPAGNIHLRW